MLDVARAYDLDFRFPAGDDTIGACLKRHGEFARPEVDVLVEHADPAGGTMLDVGANIGAICLPFAKARPAWRVVGIEGHRGLANLLATNAWVNELYNVEAFHAAAGPQQSIVRFPAPSLRLQANYGTMSLARPPNASEPTLMFRLDDLAPRNTALVKIDVEGYEPEVLAGADRLLAAKTAIWLVEAGPTRPDVLASVSSTFQCHGYDLRWLFAPFVTPLNAGPAPGSPTLGDFNLVAFPDAARCLWDLPAFLESLDPPQAAEHRYLARYGYSVQAEGTGGREGVDSVAAG